ncbi:patatin-like phospholipase family protein [Streptomyces sp. KM273126]|uniref:patatin-like phospholipase family protein n=1 Tax=Streptomyces sp. KM273126 TaxID=2545247 RepID=UPI00103C454E|nr:patatin-like phospholipase family protein [Streptomyces sp. KM273126]MBA2806504.1 patatin-like phospholipase family protein [Streptomyces sp. KM273126]
MADTALVLGGGGLTAYAWQVGMLAGLADAGLDLGGADVLAGTSAGSLLAVELAAGAAPADLYGEQVSRTRAMLEVDFTLTMTAKYLWAALGTRDPEAMVKRLARLALAVRDVSESDVFDAIGPQLPVQDWPERPVRLFALDALTGEPKGFSADSGVDLVRAMSASCALPPLFPPITIGEGRWMDGGVRSTTNADLVHDCRRVVVLAPIPKGPGAGPSTSDQVASLVAGGAQAALLVPDRAARRAFGRNPLDAPRIPGAAREGRRQAAEHAEQIRAVWHG